MKGCELAKVGVGNVHIKTLALVDESAAVCCHVDQMFLLDLPYRLVKSPKVKVIIFFQSSFCLLVKMDVLHQNGTNFAPHSGNALMCDHDEYAVHLVRIVFGHGTCCMCLHDNTPKPRKTKELKRFDKLLVQLLSTFAARRNSLT
jgi:hypothetical protein